MNRRSRLWKHLFLAVAIVSPHPQAGVSHATDFPQDGDPGRLAIEQSQAKRRAALGKLEEATSALRNEVIEGGRDVVAGQNLIIKKAKHPLKWPC